MLCEFACVNLREQTRKAADTSHGSTSIRSQNLVLHLESSRIGHSPFVAEQVSLGLPWTHSLLLHLINLWYFREAYCPRAHEPPSLDPVCDYEAGQALSQASSSA